jgi:hypothetical protein
MHVFETISEAIAFIRSTDLKSPFPPDPRGHDYEWIDLGLGKGAIIPSLNKIASLNVYRGQNQRYRPCVPTALRGSPDKLDLFIYGAQISEFEKLLDNPRASLCREIGLHQNAEALAQHYELRTLHLDVTQSIEVASFFACARKSNSGVWMPETNGHGVIYRSVLLPELRGEVVGIQAYPRPKEQYAHSIKLRPGEDFESMPHTDIFEFKHNEEESLRIIQSFDHGKTLFLYDPLTEKAKLILANPNLSERSVRRMMKKRGCDAQLIRKTIKEIDMRLRDTGKGAITDRNEYAFNNGELRVLRASLTNLKSKILGSTGYRPVFAPASETA